MLLRGSNKRCDQVIRTLFNAAYLDVDEWEALCRDHNSYSLNVPADPDATITSLHCRELSTTSKMLLPRSSRRTPPAAVTKTLSQMKQRSSVTISSSGAIF
jgi:hypothetical protein